MDINNLWSDYDLNSKKQNTRCLAINTILEGKYLVGPVLGQGGFGITYVGYDLNMEAKIAIKEYFPVELVSRDTTTMHGDRVLSLSGEKSVTYKQGLKKYVAEAQNVSQFSEIPGVVSVKDFFYANETAYIVMEYIDGISLKDYLKEKGGSLTEEETLKIMRPLLEALVQVHKSGIIHRDISPDNIMLTFEGSGHSKVKSVKLIDFGAARMTAKNDQKSLTIILKHGYAPEEQYRTHGEQGSWTDVYALCAVLYRMLTGETPVPAMDRMFQDELKTFDKFHTKVSANTSAAILKGLAVKKDERIQNVQELIGALYEGVKVKSAGVRKTAQSGKSKTGLFGGIGVAAVAAAAIAVFAIGGKNAEPMTPAEDTAASAENLVTVGENEDESSRIVWTTPDVLLAAGDEHVISLREDGTVLAAGNNDQGQCEVSDWYDIAAVYTSRSTSAGLRKDGTVVVAGNDELSEAVSSWSGIIQLAMDHNYMLGLTQDGTVVSAGRNENGCCDTGDWENVASIWSAVGVSFGITNDGELLIAGTDDYYANELVSMKEWKDLTQVGFVIGDGYFYGLKADGTVVHTSAEPRENVESWKDITYLVPTCYSIAGLKDDGTIVADHNGAEQAASGWNDVVSIAGTLDYLTVMRADGTIAVTSGSEDRYEKEGLYSIEEILAMENIKQAEWVNDYLMILCEDGELIASAAESFNVDKIEIPEWNEPIERIEADHEGLAGLTPDGRVLREERNYLSLGVSADEMSSDEAQDRKDKTPRIYNSWKNVTQLSNGGNYMAALLEDGTVKVAGFPEYQPSTDVKTGLPTQGQAIAETWSDIKQVHAMMQNVVGLKEDGTLIWTLEEDWYGLDGYDNLASIWTNPLGSYGYIAGIANDGSVVNINLPFENGMSNTAGWTDMVKLEVSDEHLTGLRADGKVLACGSNFAGKCDVEEWENVVDISTCNTATVGVTEDGRLLMAGAFPNDIYQAGKWSGMNLDKMLEK